MRRITSRLTATALLLFLATPLMARQDDSTASVESPTLASSYWTFGGLYHSDNREYELMVFAGQTWPFGGGGWTLRSGLGAGFAFWGFNDAGALGGLQIGLERMLTGDRIQLRDGQPLEVYALLGGAAYAGWNLEERPGATELVPAVTGGIGIRWRGRTASDPMVTLELYHEERLADYQPRLYIRFDYMSPRSTRAAIQPAPGRP